MVRVGLRMGKEREEEGCEEVEVIWKVSEPMDNARVIGVYGCAEVEDGCVEEVESSVG